LSHGSVQHALRDFTGGVVTTLRTNALHIESPELNELWKDVHTMREQGHTCLLGCVIQDEKPLHTALPDAKVASPQS
jgi:hypothetical protein